MSAKRPEPEREFTEETHDAYDSYAKNHFRLLLIVIDLSRSKSFSKHYDPCQEVADKSIKCLHRNPGNKDLCNDYFQAYRDCKKAWVSRSHLQSLKLLTDDCNNSKKPGETQTGVGLQRSHSVLYYSSPVYPTPLFLRLQAEDYVLLLLAFVPLEGDSGR